MKVLGIESTAHTFGVGIFDSEKGILANEIGFYQPGYSGFIPRKLVEHHAKEFSSILGNALKKANLTMRDIDLIAVSQGPGIGSVLKFGVIIAKYLALKYSLPLVGVHHGFAHCKISQFFSGFENPIFLYVSGGNTQLLIEERPFLFRVIGETLDIGVGNLFDVVARELGLKSHGGELEKIALKGKYHLFPYSVKGMDVAFSGLVTHVKKVKSEMKKEDVAYSVMHTAFAELVEASERAMHLFRKKEIIICGGVAQSKILQRMMKLMCEENGFYFFVAENTFNRDNGAMIAYAGYLFYKRFGSFDVEKMKAVQNYRFERILEVVEESL